MKKIVFTVTNDLTYDQRMQKICGSLSEAGHDVLLLGRQRKSSRSLQEESYKQKRLKCLFSKGKLFYIEYNIRLFIFLLFHRFDVYGAVDLDTMLPNMLVAGLRRKKLVYDAHEYFTEVPELIGRPAVQGIWRAIEKFCVPQADLCYTVGECIAELFEVQYKKPFHVIMNAPILKEEPLPETQDFILYQGALNMGRGLEELIDSMRYLPMKLLLAGEGDLSRDLRELVASAGLGDKVEFMGYVEPRKLKELTPKAFAGYNLLENLGKSYYYSLSNKFFDYMHAEVPSLSNPFPEYRKINEKFEVSLLTNLSTESIVLNIQRLLQDKAYYTQLKLNCRLAKEKYNWQCEEKKLIELYDSL